MGQVNRYIQDNPDLDDVDHALGRPFCPSDSYRNYYATSCPKQIAQFRKSQWWCEGETQSGMTFFHVTDAGKSALKTELAKPSYGRLYRVTSSRCDGEMLVVAKSRSAARYACFLEAELTDVTFMEFCDGLRVRLACN